MSALLNFFNDRGIQLSADGHSITGPGNSSTRVIPLQHQRILAITGADTQSFLQGQITCDMDTVYSRGSALGAHCNIKGHMLSLFRVIKVDSEQVWLRMQHDIFESAVANLKKYMIFSKAEAEEISDTVAGVGITGAGAQALIEKLFEQSPSEDDGVLSLSNGVVVRVPGDRFEIWMEQQALVELLQTIPDEVDFGSTEQWPFSEISAGVPDLRPETQEHFIPQMCNFQAVGGVSFTKGCYTGQEVITRLQHRGVLKKPMYLAEATGAAPQPAQTITSPSIESAGEVVLCAQDPDDNNRHLVLAVINKKAADEEELSLSGSNAQLTLLDLPYELDEELFSRKVNRIK